MRTMAHKRSKPFVKCPFCNESVRVDRIQRHLGKCYQAVAEVYYKCSNLPREQKPCITENFECPAHIHRWCDKNKTIDMIDLMSEIKEAIDTKQLNIVFNMKFT